MDVAAGWSKMAATRDTGARTRAATTTPCRDGDGHFLLGGHVLTGRGCLIADSSSEQA